MVVCNNILLIIIINSYIFVFVQVFFQYTVTSLFECRGQVSFLYVVHIVFTFRSMDPGHKKHLALFTELVA